MTQGNVNKEITKMIEDCQQKGLWGQIQIDFQRGKPVVIRVSETIKLKENNHNYGKQY